MCITLYGSTTTDQKVSKNRKTLIYFEPYLLLNSNKNKN